HLDDPVIHVETRDGKTDNTAGYYESKNRRTRYTQQQKVESILDSASFYSPAASSAILTMTCAAFSISSADAYSNLPWKFSPPVNRFGVGRPLYDNSEPSVPPLTGLISGVIFRDSIARLAFSTMCIIGSILSLIL